MRMQNRFFNRGMAGLAGDVPAAEIAAFVSANNNNPKAVYDKAYEHGLSTAQIANATGYTQQLVAEFLRAGAAGWTDWEAYKRSLTSGSSSPAPAPSPASPAPAPAPAPSPAAPAAPAPAPTNSATDYAKRVRDFISANSNNPKVVYETAMRENLTSAYIATVTGYTVAQVAEFMRAGAAGWTDYQAYLRSLASGTPAPAPSPSVSPPPAGNNFTNSDGSSSSGDDGYYASDSSGKVVAVVAVGLIAMAMMNRPKKRGRRG